LDFPQIKYYGVRKIKTSAVWQGKRQAGGDRYNRDWERWLEFGVGVGADFAVQVDLFVLRGGPFHD
jgi:hypothetical protein